VLLAKCAKLIDFPTLRPKVRALMTNHPQVFAKLMDDQISAAIKAMDDVVLQGKFLDDLIATTNQVGRLGGHIEKLTPTHITAWKSCITNSIDDAWRLDIGFLAKFDGNVWTYTFASGPRAGILQKLPNATAPITTLTKIDPAQLATLRSAFTSGGTNSPRSLFLKSIGNDPNIDIMLKQAGFSAQDIPMLKAKLKAGELIDGYAVHHKLPLGLGGDNLPANFVLIKNDPFHHSVSAFQNSLSLPLNTPTNLAFPMVKGKFYSPPYIE
jgi:hypothetical protein